MRAIDSEAASLGSVASTFGRIGNLTFGGGNATVAALQRELVGRKRWLTDTQFALCYALSRVTPGTNLLAFCTACGWILKRWRGALVTVLVASIPSCLIAWAVTVGFETLNQYASVRIAIAGAVAASVGILLASFWILVQPHLTRANWQRSSIIVAASIGLSLFARMSPVLVLAIAAVAGFLWTERPES